MQEQVVLSGSNNWRFDYYSRFAQDFSLYAKLIPAQERHRVFVSAPLTVLANPLCAD